ncbi:nuclear transport factor 2 family protein [Flavobacterium nackdongense]|uniref:Nuclear transport factor 2 family protein n=1 Tax=Flavobacterium nackdongense TaxID=2547394 RepID=A0A4V1AGY9_9FLAO|nr:nuclear transport factor 2 family protein [Flavobacterium nackdongense]QBN19702.1 nuclear transport factor 2 family protein [Flavobacterium nackdongense]
MKYSKIIVAVLLFQCSGWAQDRTTNKEEAVVASQVELLRQGLMTADGTKLAAVTSSGLTYGHSGGNIENQSAFIENVVKKKSNVISLEFQNQTISFAGNTAIVRHIYLSHTKDGGVEKETKIGVMQVWQKQKKQWLMIARQAYKLPAPEKI